MSSPPTALRAPLTTAGAYRVEDAQARRASVPPVMALINPLLVGVDVSPDAQTVVSFTVARVGGRRDRPCTVHWRVVTASDGLQPIDFVGDALPSGEVVLRANSDARIFVVRLNPATPPLTAKTAKVVLENPTRCEIDPTRASVVLQVNPGVVDPPDPQTPWVEVWVDPEDASLWDTVWGGAGAPA